MVGLKHAYVGHSDSMVLELDISLTGFFAIDYHVCDGPALKVQEESLSRVRCRWVKNKFGFELSSKVVSVLWKNQLEIVFNILYQFASCCCFRGKKFHVLVSEIGICER